jgi:hypothetical protein
MTDKVYTADQGQPPKEPDDKSAGKVDKKGMPEQLGSGIVVKKASGGTASARADGCAERGHTRGTIIACGGGYMKK